MHKKFRWSLSKLQYPNAGHIVVTDANYQHWKEFAPNLESCIDELRKSPELNSKGDAAMYGLAAKIPDKSMIGEAIMLYMEAILEIQ